MKDKDKKYTIIIPVWIRDQDGYAAYTKYNLGFCSPEKCSIEVFAETPDQALEIFHEKLSHLLFHES